MIRFNGSQDHPKSPRAPFLFVPQRIRRVLDAEHHLINQLYWAIQRFKPFMGCLGSLHKRERPRPRQDPWMSVCE